MRRFLIVVLTACGSTHAQPDSAASLDGATDASETCSTRISYGASWIRPAQHDTQFDEVDALVTWDGNCTVDGANAYATLSNGWKPYFTGHACELAIDPAAGCHVAPACATRIMYGDAWLHPAGHDAQYDIAGGRVFWDGACRAAGGDSVAQLSNGWAPHFTGASSCVLGIAWQSCGGVYVNPVVPHDCADPGVVRDGDRYVMSCTSGNAANAFPIYLSSDLVTWTQQGHILPASARPAWALHDFWAPEIHRVGTHWVAYFSARGADERLAIGAAYADSATGPFTALATPLVHDASIGLIDASEFTASNGTSYLLWKEDGNAQGAPTPIRIRQLAPDGLSLVGATGTLITNDQPWEGAVVEGPFLVEHAGSFYLFYSGNAYYDGRYAIGVARASSPTGPFTKAPQPIVVTSAAWIGPGHCSLVENLDGDSTYLIYHAWRAGHVNGPGDARVALVDQIEWRDGWPVAFAAPSLDTRPVP